ncbi:MULTISPECIES: competence/damage-inducible protein A [Clostridium]|uniref:Putative competence-damage inducible protein n=1 Tax=Clostridium senegalense TaxID=1465809 RepID=A0A6M0H2L7_9CLOT|nr:MULTISPECIES: competence/damage-inducible protein A [Clostridium]NEU04343.1 competence/damage-inducible protein A [Clostridium senegalense]
MKCEIIAVGTELLLGDILNTNAQYLSRRLSELGIFCYHQSVVGDNPQRLKETYELAFKRADLVITTGGLGPTKDDLTKEISFEFFKKESVLHEESLKRIEDRFEKMGREMAKNNIKQAYFPKDAIVLRNDNGTAPGCIINENNKILINLPGPPKEMKPMFEESVVPYLSNFQNVILISKVLRVIGIGESSAEEMISHIIENQTNPTVAPYAKDGEVTFRITATAENENKAKELIVPIEEKLKEIFKENLYGEGDDTLEDVLGKILVENNLTVSTAESCTGGLLGAKLINYPGISAVFLEGAITYSNDAKMRTLGVKEETLKEFGAVSSETAKEMAEGIAKRCGARIGISTTGIAGPGGGTDEKPVGLVYVGVYIDGEVSTKKLNLLGNRQQIRNRATQCALDFLRRKLCISKHYKDIK